jgi:hypothetical protein
MKAIRASGALKKALVIVSLSLHQDSRPTRHLGMAGMNGGTDAVRVPPPNLDAGRSHDDQAR